MKSKNFQEIVVSKRQDRDGLTKVFRGLSEKFCLKTIERWCKMIDQTGSINIGHPADCLRIVRTLSTIERVKNRMKRRGRVSPRRLSKI